MKMKVAGLGQCSLDYIALLEGYPEEDSKKEVSGFTVQGGGPVATALVALSRLGVKTYFMGRVSDDEAGAEIKRGLLKEKVDIKGLKIKRGGASQLAVILVDKKKGTRTICWQRPTVAPLSPKDVDPSMIRKKDFLLLDGLMEDASLKAAEIARANKIPVMLDAGRVRPGMLRLAALSDYIVCAEEFAKGLRLTPKETLQKLSLFKPKGATVTLGRKGSLTWHGGKIFSQSTFKIKTVDTTGAGDVFHGGYIYGLLRKWEIERAVEFASAFAALKCLEPGGRAGIPSLKKTLSFIKRYGKK